MILGGALLWGTTGTVQAFAPAGFDPLVIGSLRLLIGGLALLLLALQQQEIVRIRLGNPLAFFLAALFIAGYQLCFFTAVFKTGVAIGTAIGIGSAPVAGGLLGFLFRGERLGRHWLLATLGLLLLNEQLDLQAGSGIILIFIGLAVLIRAAPNTTLQAH